MNFRIAESKDLETIFPFWRKIFNWDDKRAKVLENYVSAGVKARTNKILLMEENGKLMGSVLNVLSVVYYEELILKKASVGEVSIDPAFQGRGLGHKLMTENQKFLASIGVDIARLGGLTKFYSRFGYVTVPTESYQMLIEPIVGGVKQISPMDIIKIDETTKQKIRKLVLPDELDLWRELHNEFHNGNLFAEHIDEEHLRYWQLRSNEKDNITIFGFFSSQEQLQACIMAWGEALENVVDVAYRDRDACINLIKYLVDFSMSRNAKVINFTFAPEDILAEVGLKFRKIVSLTKTASSMVALINIDTLFEKLMPILTRRIIQSGMPADNIKLNIADLQKEISIKTSNNSQPVTIDISYQDLCLLLCNHRCASELIDRVQTNVSAAQSAIILSALFPYKGTPSVSLS